MADLEHDALRESAALYVLGTLGAEERAAFEAHVRECAMCAADVRAFRAVADGLPYTLPQIDPPASLRDRVLAVAREGDTAAPSASRAPSDAARRAPLRWRSAPAWLSAAALLVICVGAGVYALSLRQRLGRVEEQLHDAIARLTRSEQQLAVATRAAAGIQTRLAVLTAPDLKQVTLAGQPPAPGAAGRAFWSRSRGLVFAASDLPVLPAGRTYQLWYLTAGAPVSAGVFKPDETGRAAVTGESPSATLSPTGLAVSIEPEGGVPAPTGAIYLAGATQ
jgi:anti-sigma-K factor RskA